MSVRGLHLPEKHVTWRGEAIPGSLFDFALYFFHNYQALLAKGSGPYFDPPETQSWQEAAWCSEASAMQKIALSAAWHHQGDVAD